MTRFGPETVVATYRVRAKRESEFLKLLGRHWPTLHRLGFTSAEPALVLQGTDATGGTIVFEIFTWKSPGAVQRAHEHIEVAAIWEALEPLVEDRRGCLKWEFPHVHPVRLRHART